MMIYLDNAATSWPKPEAVHEAVSHCLREVGANPGRSGHRLANQAERVRFETREALAKLLAATDPMRVIFTSNATTALNLVIAGLLAPGTHVVTTGMEHNAVMRPLRALEQRGVSISIMSCDPDGSLDPQVLDEYIRPETHLIVANHASNVCGTVLPIREIGAVAKQHGIPFLVDSAQTAGCRPIDLVADNIDLLAFSGHKGLLGPTGIGGLAIHDDFDIGKLPPLVRGGTGSRSEHEHQPDFLPDKYEAGTPNLIGLAGLRAGVRYVLERGVDEIGAHEQMLTQQLIDGLREIPGVRVFGTHDANRQTAVVSFTVNGQSASDIAHALDEQYEIMCRPGLHCAPRAHQTMGTFPNGTIRFAPGALSNEAEIAQAIAAVGRVAESLVE